MGADALDLTSGMARCGACGSVFNFIQRSAAAVKMMPRPRRMLVTQRNELWTCTWQWFQLRDLAMAAFCLLWDTFLVFWYYTSFGAPGPMKWIAIFFPMIHVAVGISFTYAVLARFMNRTTVKLNDGWLDIVHYPLPWRGNRRMHAQEIHQLFCDWSKSRDDVHYHLSAVLRDGRRIRLLNLPALADARFLEQQIESRLGIIPQPVSGECSA